MAPESDQLSQDIREIKWHQEAIDGSMELLIRANKKSILGEILSFFGDARRRADVYTEMLAENRSVPVLGEWVRRAARISTRFYRENPREKKAALLAEIEGELEDALGRMKEVRSLSASRNRIFISHSNVFPKILQ